MEGVIERQKAALNALDDEWNGLKNERDHFHHRLHRLPRLAILLDAITDRKAQSS
jgi:hypothetical protein